MSKRSHTSYLSWHQCLYQPMIRIKLQEPSARLGYERGISVQQFEAEFVKSFIGTRNYYKTSGVFIPDKTFPHVKKGHDMKLAETVHQRAHMGK